ncbi:membrane protein [Lactiplantibacillus plantarum]|nr:membrane protein [Lactiplantibacillus plantarum]
MSNLEISKNWEDNNLLELSINAKSKFGSVKNLV